VKKSTLIVLCGILFLFSCSQQGMPLPQSHRSSENFASPILEVTTTAYGAAYPKEGDILQMRLFEDGRFEYDDFPDYDPPRFTSGNVTITRKEGRLALPDVQKLVALAESDDFLSAEEEYRSLQSHTDTEWATHVSFRQGGIQKSITVWNFWDTQYTPSLKGNYPNSLVELLEQVEILKAKAIGQSSYQWLAKPKASP
jgi:hypothetical protein